MAKEELEIIITAKDNASGKIQSVNTGLGQLGKLAGGAALGALTIGAAAATGATIALGKGLAYSIDQAMQAQDVQAQLEAVLKSTGGVAGVTADSANDLATALSQVTRFDDEAVLSGESLLLTFTNIGQNIFPQATQTMLDMSQALGTDLQSSATMLGKALQDPILGVSALRRVGVNFTEDQQAMIKSLVESGNALEAQNMILKELQIEFGGSAEAAGKTFGGQLDILRNNLNNVAESIGSVLIPVLSQAMSDLGPVITDLATQLAALVQTDEFKAWLTETANFIVAQLIPAVMRFTEWLINDLIPGVQKASEWFNANLLPALELIGKVLGTVLPPIMSAFVKGWEIQFKIFEKVKGAIDSVISSFKWLIDWIGKVASGLANLKLPDWLTPGSPTPLELGLIGINKAMKQLASTTFPAFGAEIGFSGGMAPAAMGAGGGSVTLVYSPALSMADAEEFQTRIQPFIERGLRAQRRG